MNPWLPAFSLGLLLTSAAMPAAGVADAGFLRASAYTTEAQLLVSPSDQIDQTDLLGVFIAETGGEFTSATVKRAARKTFAGLTPSEAANLPEFMARLSVLALPSDVNDALTDELLATIDAANLAVSDKDAAKLALRSVAAGTPVAGYPCLSLEAQADCPPLITGPMAHPDGKTKESVQPRE